ncbi:hypothetical protein OROGR_014558 [Orobanche gracilis]
MLHEYSKEGDVPVWIRTRLLVEARGELKKRNHRTSNNEAFRGAFEEGTCTKLMEKEVHSEGSSTDFSIYDKVFGDKIKKELSRIQTELRTSNPNLKFSFNNALAPLALNERFNNEAFR